MATSKRAAVKILHKKPMLYGIDYLGGAKYPRAMLKAHPKGWAAGIFLRTFGDASRVIEKMGASGKFSEIVVHLSPFDSSHRYPIDRLRKQLRLDAAWLDGVAKRHPGTKFLLSPFCEHNHARAKMGPLFAELRALAPSCLMLNSVWQGDEVPGVITEIHLENSRPRKKPKGEYTVSFDGFGGDGSGDMPDADVQAIIARYSDARHIRAWNFRFNGKFGHKDKTPLPERRHWPTVDYIRGHAALMKVREIASSWPASALYKPFSDDHGEGGKDNKAMCILRGNAALVNVYDAAGNKIDTMRRMQPDHVGHPKGARYYSARYAYQIGNKAQQNTGRRLIRIGEMPLTDADLRSGLFR